MNKKTLIISDIHLRWRIVDKIIKHESPDEIVFLGDYFDQFGDTDRDNLIMAQWLGDSLSNPNRIHLFGNHDVSYAFPHRSYKCSGYDTHKEWAINSVLKKDDWKKLKLFHSLDDKLDKLQIVCSHAGIHPHFYTKYGEGRPFIEWLTAHSNEALNNAFEGMPCHQFLRAGEDRGGLEVYGGLLWIDYSSFEDTDNQNVFQIFGHTPQNKPIHTAWHLALDTHNSHYAIYNTSNQLLTTHWIGDM